LVSEGKIKSLEEIYLYSLPIKEYQIIDRFVQLQDEVMKIMPVQKQTNAGQRTRFKAFVVVGDHQGHLGLGVKCASEVANAIRGALILAKLSVVPIRKGYWGSRFGRPHTVPCKATGKCGSVLVRLVPAPRGTGIVAARTPKKLLAMAGLEDVFTTARGKTKTMGNFAKATFAAVLETYKFLTPDLWASTKFLPTPYELHADTLAKKKVGFA
jgi:small subunit ribosomal protein S2e